MKRLFTLLFAVGFAVCAHALSWVAVNTATQRNNLLTYASGLVDTLPAPYADKVAAFVSEVQADGTTTNWMEMTIQFAYNELLAPTMGATAFMPCAKPDSASSITPLPSITTARPTARTMNFSPLSAPSADTACGRRTAS